MRKRLQSHRYFGQNTTVETIVKKLSGDSVSDIQKCMSGSSGTRAHVEELIEDISESLQEVVNYEKQALEQSLDDMKDFEQISKGSFPSPTVRSPSPTSPVPSSSSGSSSTLSRMMTEGSLSPFNGGAGIPARMDYNEPMPGIGGAPIIPIPTGGLPGTGLPGTPRISLTSKSGFSGDEVQHIQENTGFFF